jgi:hypothetical protein
MLGSRRPEDPRRLLDLATAENGFFMIGKAERRLVEHDRARITSARLIAHICCRRS